MFQLFLIVGFCTLGICLTRQYHYVNENKTWAEAQSYCREHYVDLASVDNREETQELVNLVDVQDRFLAWIGLYDDMSSWRWSLDEDNVYEENERNFRNWDIAKPRNEGGNRLCAEINGKVWAEADCYTTRSFICYTDRANPEGNYIFINLGRTWRDAQRYCRTYYTDLASVRNENENKKLRTLLPLYYGYAWIGLYRTRSWSDNSNSTFSLWTTGQPDNAGGSEYCTAVFFSNSTWSDKTCNLTIPFVCYNASGVSRQYLFVNENKSWAEAQTFCRQNYTDLATIENMEDMNRLINTVNGSYTGLAWIGLYDDLDSWRWSYDNNSFYKEGERDFRGWTQQPDNYYGDEMCVYIDSAGKWFDKQCNNRYQFVCHDRKNGTDNFVWVSWTSMTWSDAQRYCRANYTDLASVRNWTDNQRILNLTAGNYTWIGLYRTRLWSDQHKMIYENWKPYNNPSRQQPDNDFNSQHCTAVYFSFSGQWTDENCLAKLPFICYTGYCTGSSCVSRQYRLINESKSWAEAQTFCRQNYTDLATIENMEDMNRLINTVNGSYTGLAWIGLYDDLDSWRWSLDNVRINETTFNKWYIQKPSNLNGKSLCAIVHGYYQIWYGMDCSQTSMSICYDGRANASQKYVLNDQYLNWTEAQRYCRTYYTDLASVRNKAENEKLRTLLPLYYGYAWIGLYRTRSWSDNSNSTFSLWKPGQPDNAGESEYCTAVFFSNSTWSDETCNLTIPFVCYNASGVSRQYLFVNESKSWAEAQTFCRQNYTDLATIENMEDMNRLNNTVNRSYTGLAWIGLYDDLDSWRWSYDNNSFYKEGERDFRGWTQQPDNYYGDEMCVQMSSSGEWFDRPCTTRAGSVCYTDKNNTFRYVWISEPKTWSEAQRYCRESYTDLASVRNETELKQIQNVSNGNTVWIGLFRNRLWSDQSNSTFTFWKREVWTSWREPDNGSGYYFSGLPNEHCTAVDLYFSGYWTDQNCFLKKPFFCYSVPVVGLRVKVQDGKGRSESEVKELVLMQIKELTRLGLPSNFTMKVKSLRRIDP